MLPNDALISDIVSKLENPIEYVRGVFENMHKFKKEYGSAYVRIGITGEGKIPNYRIQSTMDEYSFLDEYPLPDENLFWKNTHSSKIDLKRKQFNDKYFLSFYGNNHREIGKNLTRYNWSSGYMDYESVKIFLGDLRNINR